MKITYTASFSHIGKREINQDYLISDPDRGIFILADGVGGYHHGEVASKIACESAHQYLTRHTIFDHEDANQLCLSISTDLQDAAREHPAFVGMSTTLALTQFHKDFVSVVHIGDSRVYAIDSNPDQFWRTKDHSHVQELVDKGMIMEEETEKHPLKHLITRCFQAIPIGDLPEPAFSKRKQRGHEHIWVLCTDGIFDAYSEKSLLNEIQQNFLNEKLLIANLELKTKDLSSDNVSVILVKCQGMESGE